MLFSIVFDMSYLKQTNFSTIPSQLRKIFNDETVFCQKKTESHFYLYNTYFILFIWTLLTYKALEDIFYPATMLCINSVKRIFSVTVPVHQAMWSVYKIRKLYCRLLTKFSHFVLIDFRTQKQSYIKKWRLFFLDYKYASRFSIAFIFISLAIIMPQHKFYVKLLSKEKLFSQFPKLECYSKPMTSASSLIGF